MKKLLLFPALFLLAACASHSENDAAKAKQEILAADSAMCVMAMNDGFSKALLQYADADFVKLNNGVEPLIGREKYAKFVESNGTTKLISWRPYKVEVAASGELGYTWGYWEYDGDSVQYGNYFTAWKKQADGNWKMLLDGGNDTPKPADESRLPH